MDEERFWNITFSRFLIHLRAAQKQKIETANNAIRGAWYGEMFARQSKLDPLNKYLIKIDAPKSEEQIEQEFAHKVERLFGGLPELEDVAE